MKTPAVITKTLDTVSDWLQPARAALSRAADAERELRAKHEAASRERAQLGALPPPLDEILAQLDARLRTLAGETLPNGRDLAAAVTGSPDVDVSRDGRHSWRGISQHVLFAHVMAAPPSWGALAAMFPAEVREYLGTAIRRDVVEFGASFRERPRLLDEANTKVDRREAEHEALCDAAGELGVELPTLEENRLKKIRAEREAEAIQRFNMVNAAGIERGGIRPATRIEEAR